jgi:hypothetical protein
MHESGSELCSPARVVERNGSRTTTDAQSPSTAPQDKRCPILADSTTTEQLARRVQALEAENERIRAAASEDLQNWTLKYTVLMRENTRLKPARKAGSRRAGT